MANSWRQKAGCRNAIVCLSPRDGANFRKTIDRTYKSGRAEKPLAYWPVVEFLEKSFTVVRIANLEADDVMGIMSTSENMVGSVIVSIDKDMKTIPGYLLNPQKDEKPRKINEHNANRFWLYQTLTGDTVDGYPGCRGVGDKGAEKALGTLSNFAAMWAAVVETFIEKGFTEDDAIHQARLARILRRADYDREKETIRLWHPAPSRVTTLSIAPLITCEMERSSRSPSSPLTECLSSKATSSSTSSDTSSRAPRSKTSRRRVPTSTV